MTPNPNRFRILSLDGGGIKGTFSAAFLAGIEEMTDKKIADHFDLITGTSTGGIIAIALAMGISAADVLNFYQQQGPKIFPSTGIHRRILSMIRWGFASKYSTHPLRVALEGVLGELRLGEAKRRLVIPSFNADNGDVYLYKTAHHERFKQDYKVHAVDVALSTAAAPTYFPVFSARNGMSLIDGGIWANCPATVGLIEAIAYLDKQPKDIEILSVGTTSSPFSVSRRRRSIFGGLLLWNKGIVDLQMQAQVASALAQAKVLTGGKILRIDVPAQPGRFSMDDSRCIDQLVALGKTEARHREHEISNKFLDAPADSFTPYYQPDLTRE
jgi:uncharacterized protein